MSYFAYSRMKLSISGNALFFLFIPSMKLSSFISHSIFCSLSQFTRLFKNVVSSRNAKTRVLSFPLVKDNSNNLDCF